MNPVKILSEATNVEYPTICPFSQNNKYILLQHPNGFTGLYDITGKLIKLLPSEISSSSHPKWSRKFNEIIYYTRGRELRAYNVETNLFNTIRSFDEYLDIGKNPFNAETDISRDGAHFAIYALKSKPPNEIIVYNINSNIKEFTYTINDSFDAIKITPLNNVVLSNAGGIWLLGKIDKKLAPTNSHAAVTLWNNREYLLYSGAAALNENKGAVEMIDIETLRKKQLLTFDWRAEGYAVHISTCDKDFCEITLYSKTLPTQLWRVYYEGTQELLYEFQNIERNYTSQPKASLSRDGAYIAFSTDDGQKNSVWLGKLDNKDISIDSNNPIDGWTPVDYRAYLDYEFKMIPQSDGSLRMFQKKVR